jgi:hypothetical protein
MALRKQIVSDGHDGDLARGVAGRRGRGPSDGHDGVDLEGDELTGQCGQPLVAAFGKPPFDVDGLTLDVSEVAQRLFPDRLERIGGRARKDDSHPREPRRRLGDDRVGTEHGNPDDRREREPAQAP